MKLYEIKQKLKESIDWALSSEDPTEAIHDIEKLEYEKIEKVLSIGKYIKNLTYDKTALKMEEDHLKERRRTIENKIQRLKDYLTYAVPGETFEDPQCKLSWRKSQKLHIADWAVVPEQFQKVKIEPDRTALTKAFKAGEYYDGIDLLDCDNLQVK